MKFKQLCRRPSKCSSKNRNPNFGIFLVYSGLRLVMARGNEKDLTDAKKNLLWVIIGGVILFGAWTLVKVLKGTFDEIDLVFINNLINFIV
ncbi:MAG: pilin [Candidatus Paceibacterota bacterium]